MKNVKPRKTAFFIIWFMTFFLLFLVGCEMTGEFDSVVEGKPDSGDGSNAEDFLYNDDDEGPEGPFTYSEPCPDGPEFSFILSGERKTVPYPNNIYTIYDPGSPTGRRVNIDDNVTRPISRITEKGAIFSYLTDAVNAGNGFSTLADIYVPLDWAPNSLSFPKYWETGVSDSFFLMLLDTADKESGKIVPSQAVYMDKFIRITPMETLKQNSKYILVVTRALRPNQEQCYRASSSMKNVWDDYKNGDGGLYESAFTLLEKEGLDLQNVLAISEFDTLWATRDLNEVRELFDKMSVNFPPVIAQWTETSIWSPPNLRYVKGILPTPIIRNDNNLWERDDSGSLKVNSWENISVLLSLPDPDKIESRQPYPVVLWGHGLGALKETMGMIAELMADNGYIMVGTDDICHGEREVDGAGFLDSTGCYLDFADPLKTRDNIRETVAGKMWLARAIKNLGNVDIIPEGGDGIPDFDVENIYYAALSMGTMHGGILTGLEENIDAYVMSAAGAKYTSIIFEGPFLQSIYDISEFFDLIFQGADTEEFLYVFGHMIQHVLDPAEASNFLTHAISNPLPGLEDHSTYILQQSVASDSTAGEYGQIYFNRAAGYPQLEPFVWDVELVDHARCPYFGSGFFQYDSDEHFLLWVPNDLGDAYRRQAIHFLNSHKETGMPVIIDPLANSRYPKQDFYYPLPE